VCKVSVFFVIAVILFGASIVLAEVPQLINYQGVLVDNDGIPVSSGDYQFNFKIYDTPTGGAHIWTSGFQIVTIEDGVYTYLLGSNAQLPHDLFATDTIRWLGVTVGGDPEIDPRFRLTTTPYAYHALRADSAVIGGGWIDAGGVVKLADPNDDIGVATDFPQAKFHVIQDFSSALDLFRAETDIPPSSRLPSLIIKKDGSMGVRTADPLGIVHIEANELFLDIGHLQNDRLIIEGTDAVMGLYSEPDGPDGGAITLGQVEAGNLMDKWAILRETPYADYGGNGFRITYGESGNPWNNNSMMRINTAGNVAIGSEDPGNFRLHVVSSGGGAGGATIHANNTNTNNGIAIIGENESNDVTMLLSQHGEGPILRCDSWIGGWHSVFKVDNDGRTTCSVLELTGGSDLAEPFEISGNKTLAEGAVVVIDDENPGKLKLSERAYDTRVAGIISGAGGINPGLSLTQKGMFDGGQNVAINGRVYCLADASSRAIRPGDLLTTSSNPGHAMKASDRTRAHGAVIGKAMTSLDSGQGLVLVLVNLQ
jgi:hypothetical protein